MDLYRATFVGSLLLNSFVLYRSYRSRNTILETSPEKAEHRRRDEDDEDKLRSLKWRFIPIYLLVNGADWLQGPYIYPIYKDEKGLPEKLVAFLFVVGFLSGGISASFVGSFADRCGRRSACLVYCIVYSLSCLTLLSDHIAVLFLGRVLGGVSGTMLYSVFESWLVSEYNKLDLDDSGAALTRIFSNLTTLNSLVAIVAGVFAGWLVNMTGTAKTPFIASIACLAIASTAILCYWDENYGGSKPAPTETVSLLEQQVEPISPRLPLKQVLQSKNIIVLALTTCCFEGSLFLFIFFKFPTLTLAHKQAGTSGELPFGLIFAILMCSMMFGSMLYKYISSQPSSPPVPRLLTYTFIAASLCLCIPVLIPSECVTLWCFCLFEVCCGIYYPLMSSLKGRLIDDNVRASVYGMLRVPLNVFVVLALSTTKEGAHHRDTVFMMCCGLLLVAALVVHRAMPVG